MPSMIREADTGPDEDCRSAKTLIFGILGGCSATENGVFDYPETRDMISPWSGHGLNFKLTPILDRTMTKSNASTSAPKKKVSRRDNLADQIRKNNNESEWTPENCTLSPENTEDRATLAGKRELVRPKQADLY